MKNSTNSPLTEADLGQYRISKSAVRMSVRKQWCAGLLESPGIESGNIFSFRIKPLVYYHAGVWNQEDPGDELFTKYDVAVPYSYTEDFQRFVLRNSTKIEWPGMPEGVLVIRYADKKSLIISHRPIDVMRVEQLFKESEWPKGLE